MRRGARETTAKLQARRHRQRFHSPISAYSRKETETAMRTHPIRMVALLGTMIGLAACAAPDQWQHPQTGTAMVQQDLTDCSSTARRESWRTPAGDSFATT